jgi:ribonuclease T1
MRTSFAIALVAMLVAACMAIPTASPAPPSRPLVPVGTLGSRPPLAPVEDASDLPVVALADLPPEAATTIDLIEAGGPFPFSQDGAVFENRERLLPDRGSGYYHEYTVVTPGAADRGARRVVSGAGGEMYWTPDHYDSFAWIDR